MAFVLPVDNVESAAALLLVAQLLSPVDVGHRGLLGVSDGRVDDTLLFVSRCEHSLLSCVDGNGVRARCAALSLPHVQDVNHGLRLLMDCRGSALLLGRPKLDLLAGSRAHSQILESVVVYRVFFVLGLNSLIVAVFVEDGALLAV